MDLKKTVSDFRNMMDKNVEKAAPRFQVDNVKLNWLLRSVLKKSKVIIQMNLRLRQDKESKKDVIQFIKKLSKDKTLILITHDKELHNFVDKL